MFPDNWRRLSLTLATLVLCGCDGPPAPATRAGAITSLDTGRVAVAGGALYYEAAGSGALVILLHGGNLDRRMWDTQFALLRQYYRVVRYDARGFGRSSTADHPFAAHDDLAALVCARRLPRVTLVGLSMGGRIALDFALAHPERVDRLSWRPPGSAAARGATMLIRSGSWRHGPLRSGATPSASRSRGSGAHTSGQPSNRPSKRP